MEENEIYAVEAPQQNPQQNQNNRKDKSGKYFYCGLITGLAMSLLIVSGVYVANRLQTGSGRKDYTLSSADGKKDDSNEQTDETTAVDDAMVQKMQLIEEVIDAYFYKADVDKEAMQNGAFKGMVESLGDPYSEYYSAEELEQLYTDSQGIYYGIGAYVSLDTVTGYAKISGVIAGTPAEEADLREEDIIYMVGDEDVYGLTLQQVVGLIKGEEGTEVHMTLVRDGEQIEKDIVRARVEAPTVNYEMLDDEVAYIQITEFDTVTEDQFAEALAMAKGSGMRGLVLDLRSNPGGNLSTVVNIARMLLPKGLIVYTEDRDGNRQEYSCDGTRQLDVPLVVLVNGNSASASEILAGAIKDYGIGTLLGTTTFGKGIVQRPVELSDGSAVKLTISSYYTPNGINIHGVGIDPDVVCELDSERYYSEEKFDNQKQAAWDLIKEKIAEQ